MFKALVAPYHLQLRNAVPYDDGGRIADGTFANPEEEPQIMEFLR